MYTLSQEHLHSGYLRPCLHNSSNVETLHLIYGQCTWLEINDELSIAVSAAQHQATHPYFPDQIGRLKFYTISSKQQINIEHICA